MFPSYEDAILLYLSYLKNQQLLCKTLYIVINKWKNKFLNVVLCKVLYKFKLRNFEFEIQNNDLKTFSYYYIFFYILLFLFLYHKIFNWFYTLQYLLRCGALHVGDILLSVCGQPLTRMGVDDVTQWIRDNSGLVLQLEVLPGAHARSRYTFRAGSPDRGSTWSSF